MFSSSRISSKLGVLDGRVVVVIYDLVSFVFGFLGCIVSVYFYYELDVSEMSFRSWVERMLISAMLWPFSYISERMRSLSSEL